MFGFTAEQLVVIAVFMLLTVGSFILVYYTNKNSRIKNRKYYLVPILLAVIAIVIISLFRWYNNTAAGARNLKDFESNINNGLKREISICSEDGTEYYHYEGKIALEKNEENNHRLLFEDENGKRVMIYFGVTDHVIIKEIE